MSDFISYGKQWIDQSDIKAVTEVLKSDFLTQGRKIKEFEQALCAYTGAKYCVAVSNGAAALHLSVLACEIQPGQEGITSPNTFVASANCLVYAGLKPVFADIDPVSYNIDPEEIKKKITSKTKVIVAVDFAGRPASMREISKTARSKGIKIIEDAAHAIGSKYKTGEKVGSCKYSDLTIFSFHPVKTITTGEGGAITTNDKKLYEKLLMLRTHGITKDPKKMSKNPGPWFYEMQCLGFNYRLTDLQAALGISQLKKLPKFVKRRLEIIRQYNRAFSNLPLVKIPSEENLANCAFHLYVLKIDFKKLGTPRAQAMDCLKQFGVGTQVHYIPVHLQPYYRENYGYKKGDYRVAEEYYEQCLSLPLYPKMTDAQVNKVCSLLKKVLEKQ